MNQPQLLHDAKNDQTDIDFYSARLWRDPTDYEALAARANCYANVGRFEEAMRDFRTVIANVPDAGGAWVNYAYALQCTGNFESALTALDMALKINPNDVLALYNKGTCIERELGRVGEGEYFFNLAYNIDQTFKLAKSGRAFVNLKRGDWIEGWKDFEYRGIGGKRLTLPGRLWDGNKTTDELVLCAEQGYGDMIQFVRYAQIAADNGQPTALYCKTGLHPLFSSLRNVRLIDDESQVKEPYQWLPLMSMPRLMGTTPDKVPYNKRYLKADPDRVDLWKGIVSPYKDLLKVGICWTPGRMWKPHTLNRYLPLEKFGSIADITGVQLFSLQKGMYVGEEIYKMPFPVVPLGHDPDENENMFMDCAAIIENMDLVISTDTSVLHLAGALGKKTFAPIPIGSCWRWLTERIDTPWYKSVTLYRQTKLLNWDDTFEKLTTDVKALT